MIDENNALERMPILALRGLTIFPNMLLHFDVGRAASIRALDEAMATNQKIFLVAQKELMVDNPSAADLYGVGTISHVRQVLKMQGETVRVLIEGECRGRITDCERENPYLEGLVERIEPQFPLKNTPKTEAMIRLSYELFEEYAELGLRVLSDNMMSIIASDDPGFIADYVAQNISIKFTDKQDILEEYRPVKRLDKVNRILASEIEILKIEADLQEQLQKNIAKGQKDYILREQLKAIQTELGDFDDTASELNDYYEKISELKLDEESEEKLIKEVKRLSKQPSSSSEASVIRGYLDTCIELPWNTSSMERLDIKAAGKILEADHYGLDKVKQRILEFLAVKQLAPDLKGQIICLVGPPGVGKTSIASSIARCLNRKLARLSLGGVRDEADIRGHRKTYVGAMPGRIISALKQCGTNNPLMLFDEIDKLGNDYRGDPSAALLEVLDSEQNHAFRDHYIEIPFDLSEVMFITTANTTDTIPRALLDRMEVIELSSYTDEEKLQIAKQHLFPKQMKKHGLKKPQLRLTDDVIREIITGYTRESGVRKLERELASLCRRTAKIIAEGEAKRVNVTSNSLDKYLGVRKYHPERLRQINEIGVVTGLAWTSVGGETLEVEVNVLEGSGKLELTGNLGEVMKESALAAISYIRSCAAKLHVNPDFYKTKDIHVHFPEGAVPKDGPSAGIAICTAMVSALSGASVRKDIAMTGEISIRGRVLAIGGLKEKTMAALRHGIKTVIIPEENEKDLEEIDQTVRNALNFISVSQADAVITAALDFSHIQLDDSGPSGAISDEASAESTRKSTHVHLDDRRQ